MRARWAIRGAWVVFLTTSLAQAQHRAELDASFGYADPVGSVERGARLGDTTYGTAPFDLRVAWRLGSRVAVFASAALAPAIPKLCASVDDCIASVGRDLSLSVGVRIAVQDLWRIRPRLDVGVGYAWHASTLHDDGAVSTRTASGPTFIDLRVSAPIALGPHVAFGPFLGVRVGSYLVGRVETPLRSIDGLDGISLHGWLRIGVVVAWEF